MKTVAALLPNETASIELNRAAAENNQTPEEFLRQLVMDYLVDPTPLTELAELEHTAAKEGMSLEVRALNEPDLKQRTAEKKLLHHIVMDYLVNRRRREASCATRH